MNQNTNTQGAMPELDRTAPERIWLQVDTDGDPEDRSDTFPRNGEQTWCDHSIGGQEVEYVRADLAQVAALTAAPVAQAHPGWRWMTHPDWNMGQPIPVRIEVEDGVTYYRPFSCDATEFQWDLRSEEWRDAARPAPGVESNTAGAALPDCGEAGHSEGCCGNSQCLPSASHGQAPAGATPWRSAVLDLIDECPGLTMEQDHWLSRRVKELEFTSAPRPTAQVAPAAGAVAGPDLQPLHNLLFLAQRQNSFGTMQIVVGKARLELARVRDTAPTPAAQVDSGVVEDAAMPMQPLVRDKHGVIRFKENRIVSALLGVSHDKGLGGLNQIVCGDYTPEERMQFAQLIGYSVYVYGEWSYVSPESVEIADRMAEAFAARATGAKP